MTIEKQETLNKIQTTFSELENKNSPTCLCTKVSRKTTLSKQYPIEKEQ